MEIYLFTLENQFDILKILNQSIKNKNHARYKHLKPEQMENCWF